jgi:hypothetical protein
MLRVMENPVTVYRSADPTAQDDASSVLELLAANGIPGILADDQAPGVPAGAWEVHVAAKDKVRAEALIAANPIEDESDEVDESHALDMETVFRAAGTSSEMEAMSIKAMLESNGISAMVVADTRFPNLPEEVRVPRERVTEAKRVIAAALEAGRAGADEAEAASEI